MKFQPVIKWSGSKRPLSMEIVSLFPKEIDTYYEPFCGGYSILFQLLNSDIKVNNYVASDVNADVIKFFNLLKNNPTEIYQEYKVRWNNIVSYDTITDKQIYYNSIRTSFNETKNTHDFIFLSRTAINGLIRYNSRGGFNSPFHLTRNGINPETFFKIIMQWHKKLIELDVTFKCQSYENIITTDNDLMFLDPPYANTKGMYQGVIDFNILWEFLENSKGRYLLTFDGKSTTTDYTYKVPSHIYNKHVYLESKISSFRRLITTLDSVQESLYIKY